MAWTRWKPAAPAVLLFLPFAACGEAPAAPSPNFAVPGEERPDLDVPYVPTDREVVDKMLEIANVGPADHVIDLGSGDGRILVTAARTRGARGFGVEIDPVRVREAEANARAAGVERLVRFQRQDLFETPIGEATVLTMYLLPEVNLKLRPRILSELRPGTRIVSHAFDMGDWEPDRTIVVGTAMIHHWTVPARVEGKWALADRDGGATLALRQHFQKLSGNLRRDGRTIAIEGGELQGTRIRFTADGRLYEGIVGDGRIQGADWRGLRMQGT